MNKLKTIILLLTIFLIASVDAQKVYNGYATFYGRQAHGKRTASGERIDMNDFVAAHRSLPFGTRIKVTNKVNNKAIIIRVIDRCSRKKPFQFVDLSYGAAKHLDFLSKGRTSVTLEVLDSASLLKNEALLLTQSEVSEKWSQLDSLEQSARNALLSIPDSTMSYAVIVGSYATRNQAWQKAKLFTKTHQQKTTVRDIVYRKRKFTQVIAIGFNTFEEAEKYRMMIATKIRGARVTRVEKTVKS